jgi:hypothetical protein
MPTSLYHEPGLVKSVLEQNPKASNAETFLNAPQILQLHHSQKVIVVCQRRENGLYVQLGHT